MKAIVKSVIKTVRKEWIMNKWANTICDISCVRHTAGVFLSLRVWAWASVLANLSLPDLVSCLNNGLEVKDRYWEIFLEITAVISK